MATLVTVHGTFAQDGVVTPGSETAPDGLQWWQPGSAFEKDMADLVEGQGGKLSVDRFEWSGQNSETGRREAGHKLLEHLRTLEARKEPYCLVGHSHGGSVISTALLESAARKQPLDGLKRWITIGTPFLTLRRERLLFARLDLTRKVIFVASMMLLIMFLVYLAAEVLSGSSRVIGGTFPQLLALMAVMMSLPALIVYFVFKYLDSRSLLHYRRAVKGRAKDWFGRRWLSLTHSDDEAVQGLSLLPETKLSFFDKAFAVSSITVTSVIALPLLYLMLLTSPSTMMGLADWLRTSVYESRATPEAEKAISDLRKSLRETRAASPRPAQGAQPTEQQREIWKEYRAQRQELEKRYPEYRSTERAMRFRQRFFEQGGKPCEGGKLCGLGRDLRVNSGLLLHVVTDEVSWALGVESAGNIQLRWFLTLLLPALLVPLVFGAMALVIMLSIRTVAYLVSHYTSHALNSLTNAEVKRAAYGNDTEGEIALGASDRPVWLEKSPPRLPPGPAEIITLYSNNVAGQSLAKLRRAIGQLASGDGRKSNDNAISSYLTWKELVHGAYFDVPEFRKLVAQSVAQAEGFAPTARFKADPDFARTAEWLRQIEGGPPTRDAPGNADPDTGDVKAVAAVVGSTVIEKAG